MEDSDARFVEDWNTPLTPTFLPMKRMLVSEQRDNAVGRDPSFIRGTGTVSIEPDTIDYAIISSDGGMRKQKMVLPPTLTPEEWASAVTKAARNTLKEYYGQSLSLVRRRSVDPNAPYEFWFNQNARQTNVYVAKVLPPGSRVRGHVVAFRVPSAEERRADRSMYRSVSQVTLSTFFSDSTDPDEFRREHRQGLQRANSGDSTPPWRKRDPQASLQRLKQLRRNEKTHMRQRKQLFPQKRVSRIQQKRLERTNSSMPFGSNDSSVSRTSENNKVSTLPKKEDPRNNNNNNTQTLTTKVVLITENPTPLKGVDDLVESFVQSAKEEQAVERKHNEGKRKLVVKIPSETLRRSTRVRKKSTRFE